MKKIHHWVVIIFSCLYTNIILAQINLNIEINGVSSEVENNIRRYISIEQQKEHPLLSEERLHYLHKKSPHEITQALQPFGYYRPEIKSELIQLATQNWNAIYSISPGPLLPVKEFNFTLIDEIKYDSEFQKTVSKYYMTKGETFSHIKYKKLKDTVVKLAAERGYFDARFIEHQVKVNLKTYEAGVYLKYDSGKRYHFGKVNLNQDVIEPELLQRYIPFKGGAPYTYSDLIELQQALNDSDYFNSVEVSSNQKDIERNTIPVDVKLTPRKRNRYTLGIGYGSDTGARTKFGWDMPRVNKNGHRLNSEAKISEIGYSVGLQYRVPVYNPRTDQMIYSAGVVNEKTLFSDSTVSKVGASFNRNMNLWLQSFSLNYQEENFIVATDQGESELFIPGINLSRTWGSNVIYTPDGLRINIGLRGASDKLLSDNNFLQLQAGVKSVTSLANRHRIITRGRLGTTWTNNFHQLPSSIRFFAGGSQSVRGYSYQSLGPVDMNNNVVGGKHLVIGSVEYEYSLSDTWGAALFYDAGNANDNLDDDLEYGAGFGFRWKSPIGSVRFDFASAISVQGNPWRFHINIGPDL